jgi:hypothetical protein
MCFLGRNICNLGYGVAILQAPRLTMDVPAPHKLSLKNMLALTRIRAFQKAQLGPDL